MRYNDFTNDIFGLLWDTENNRFPINDKKDRVTDLIIYMLNRTSQIFTWTGTPGTIKPYILERFLQVYGNICITEVEPKNVDRENGLYVFFGGLGGLLDENYEPTIYTVANPFLNFNAELTIGRDCVRGRNDTSGMGLMPLFTKYAGLMNENEISLNMTAINYRISNLISADDDRTYESAKAYLQDIINGKFGAISSAEFFEGLQVNNSNDNRKITDLIEYEQYLKASWYNEIGLNSNYNMKRERIVSAEAELTDDALIPLVENMLDNRKKMIEDVRELYGDKYDLDVWDVALNPIWDLDNMYISIDKTPEADEEENDVVIDNGDNITTSNDDSVNTDSVEGGEPEPTDEPDAGTEENEDEPDAGDNTEAEDENDPDGVTVNVEINIDAETVENVETDENTETDDTEGAEDGNVE